MTCGVELVWVRLLPDKWEDDGCCGCCFVLLRLLSWLESEPSVVAYYALWLAADG